MTRYDRKRPQCRCRICQHPLYSRTAIPAETSAMCIECAIANPGEGGVVFSRTLTRLAIA